MSTNSKGPGAPFLSIDLPLFHKGIAEAQKALSDFGNNWNACVAEAMGEWLENLMTLAVARAPVGLTPHEGSAHLRESGRVEGPVITPGSIDARAGFTAKYARIRDQGGEIRPVRAKSLFIPLRPGARPGDPTLKLGVDFVLVPGPTNRWMKMGVFQAGTHYFTDLVNQKLPKAVEQIGARAWEILQTRFAANLGGHGMSDA